MDNNRVRLITSKAARTSIYSTSEIAVLGVYRPAEIETIDGPAPHLIMDGQTITPVRIKSGCITFVPRIDSPRRPASRAAKSCNVHRKESGSLRSSSRPGALFVACRHVASRCVA
jgi:hypothetical protein